MQNRGFCVCFANRTLDIQAVSEAKMQCAHCPLRSQNEPLAIHHKNAFLGVFHCQGALQNRRFCVCFANRTLDIQAVSKAKMQCAHCPLRSQNAPWHQQKHISAIHQKIKKLRIYSVSFHFNIPLNFISDNSFVKIIFHFTFFCSFATFSFSFQSYFKKPNTERVFGPQLQPMV